jgi:5-deoxy-glucuronate isomerase
MLSETLFRVPRGSGLQLLHARGDAGARELSSWRLSLGAGESATFRRDGEEAVVVLQQGRGTFSTPAESWNVQRSSVFAERATALYLPPNTSLTISAASPLEAILVATPAPNGGAPALVRPADVTVNARGRGNFAR